MKKLLVALVLGVFSVVPISAQTYSMVYPSYVPISGGAWCEVDTAQGRLCIVLPVDYLSGYFGYSGSGYNVANITASTITGTVYHSGSFSYYTQPTSLQCRFQRMGTLEVYEPYQNSYGSTSYRWTELHITSVFATNMDYVDDAGLDRQNDSYRYTTDQKILILIFCAVCLLGVFLIFRRAWKA